MKRKVLDLLLGALPLGDVDDRALDDSRFSVLTFDQIPVLQDPDVAAVLAAKALLVVAQALALLQPSERSLPVLRRQVEVPGRQRENLFPRPVAEDLGEGLIAIQNPAILGGSVDPGEVPLEEQAVARLGLIRGVLGPPLPRDVRRHANDSRDRAFGVGARRQLDVEDQALDLEGLPKGFAGESAAQQFQRLRVVAVQLEGAAADRFAGPQYGGLEAAPFQVRDHAVAVEREEHDGGVVHKRAKAFFGVAKGPLRPLAFGGVSGDDGQQLAAISREKADGDIERDLVTLLVFSDPFDSWRDRVRL